GPIVGAFVIEFLHLNIGDIAQWIGIPSLSQWWMLIIGAFYILIVLFVPYGIVGTLIGKSANVRRIFRRLLGREKR
ncbi:MAG: hypothetical protein M1368_12345, partial [Thaumarchaeota archaeon]|nr:hypothetical protein [Nitrososphaerota archaeon]